MFLKKFKLRT